MHGEVTSFDTSLKLKAIGFGPANVYAGQFWWEPAKHNGHYIITAVSDLVYMFSSMHVYGEHAGGCNMHQSAMQAFVKSKVYAASVPDLLAALGEKYKLSYIGGTWHVVRDGFWALSKKQTHWQAHSPTEACAAAYIAKKEASDV